MASAIKLITILVVLLVVQHNNNVQVQGFDLFNRSIWFQYTSVLLPYYNKMQDLYDCITNQPDYECTKTETIVKGVFESFFMRNCEDCCKYRMRMVLDMMKYFSDNKMPIHTYEGMKEMFMNSTTQSNNNLL